MLTFIHPDWPAPAHIQACTTTRIGGYSQAPYDSLNLGTRCGDNPAHVKANRTLLQQTLHLPTEPIWLQQVHGTQVVAATLANQNAQADASIATQANQVCAIMTADCLPVLFCAKDGSKIGAAHAGWRGLANGVLEATLAKLNLPAAEIMVWLGPAISGDVYEVGEEVRTAFITALGDAASPAFVPTRPNHYLADLYALARLRLQMQDVTAIFGGNLCTYQQAEAFFSYRREPTTGRLATLIWQTPHDAP